MDKLIYTIGHSNHPADTLVKLLRQHDIEVLVDIRSNPNSKWAPYANPYDLKLILNSSDILYVYLGNLLGGRPTNLDSRDAKNGKPDYQAMQNEKTFEKGINQLLEGIEKYRVCLMCSEEDPSVCHRNLLVGNSLQQHGVQVLHIRGNGQIQTDEDLWKVKAKVETNQLTLHL